MIDEEVCACDITLRASAAVWKIAHVRDFTCSWKVDEYLELRRTLQWRHSDKDIM